ncbi:MAG: prepilin-type N-terminal cleavage/methylation domain-containing protein [Thermodesulfovibrionales bacterium]
MSCVIRKNKGFTLLEVLLALLLLTIVLGAIYSTFFLAQKAVTGIDESLLKLQEGRVLLDILSREIDAAVYTKTNLKSLLKIEDRDIYGKQTSRITFTTLSPLRPGLSRITYHIEEHDRVLTLYKKMDNPYKEISESKTNESGPNQPVDLIEGLDSFTVEAKEGTNWVKTWDTAETKKMPLEMRVTLVFRIKDRPITLYETIKPKIGNPI